MSLSPSRARGSQLRPADRRQGLGHEPDSKPSHNLALAGFWLHGSFQLKSRRETI
jgi:hypothetical protein